jgi:hypothetical protein
MEDGLNDAVARLAKLSGAIGMLMWVDPTGQRWLAPLGSPEPDPDRAVPMEWAPIKMLPRDLVDW